MKMMKTALLATAAIAAVASSANANELADLKAQIEALNARVAQVETAPAVPAGYQLVAITKGEALQFGLDSDEKGPATVISVLPAADAPAGTELSITGFARAALVYRNSKAWSDEDFGVRSRAEVKIAGKTETAVGEVGAFMKLRANMGANGLNGDLIAEGDRRIGSGDPFVTSPEYWGYWNFAEGMTLAGGYTGSLSGIGFGYDGKCNCYYTDNANAGYGGNGDTTQMRVSYASGPIGFAVAIEDGGTIDAVGTTAGPDGIDGNADDTVAADNHGDKALGVAGEMKYSGDVFSGEISGGYWNKDSGRVKWVVGAGLGFQLSDMFNVSMSAGTARFYSGEKQLKANVLASATLTDGISAEVGYNWVNSNISAGDENAVLAGIYFNPVSQLTIGLEGEWIKNKGSTAKKQIDLVTVYRF
jgi:hypothetical protein